MSEMKSAALKYAGVGMPVFPLKPGTKVPMTSSGFLDATTDPLVVGKWWARWPDANIGYAIPEGQVVVDIDPRNGGRETIAALPYGFPKTLHAATAGGGDHLFFSIDPDASLKKTLGPGVDLKLGGRGYVVLAPSVIEGGGRYSWVGDERYPLAAFPTWAFDLAAKPKHEPTPIDSEEFEPKPMLPFEDGTTYGVAALEREVGRLLQQEEGGRNEALNRAAFAMGQLVAGGELKPEPVLERLELVASRIGLDSHETKVTIKSGFDAGLQEPRRAPEIAPRPSDTAKAVEALRSAPEAQEGPFWLDWTQEYALPEFLLEPLIPKSAYVLVYGPTQAAKSMVWLSLGAQASLSGYDVSYYSFENPPNIDADRLKRVGPDPEHFRLTNQPVDFSDPLQVDTLIERELGRDLIILDTYSHAMGGDFQGDHNAKAIAFAKTIRGVMRWTGATVVVIDHTGFGTGRDDPRDSSAKRQQVDVAVLMEERSAWKGPGHPAEFSMVNKKYARFSNPFELEGQVEDGGAVKGDPHGRSELKLVWSPASRAQLTWQVR